LALEDVLHPPDEDLDPLQRIVDAGRDRADLITGITVFGEPVCLINCFVQRMDGARVHHPQLWTVNEALLGVGAPPAEVQGIELRIPAMRPFYAEPLFSLDRSSSGPRETLTMTWQSSPEIAISLDQLQLVFDDDWIVSGPTTDLRLRATARIRLLPSKPRPADELRPLIGHIITLIGICRGGPVNIAESRLLLNDERQARHLHRSPEATCDGSESAPWLGIGNLAPVQRTFERWLALCEANTNAVAVLSEYLRSARSVPTADRLIYLVRFIEEYYRSLPTSVQRPKKKGTLKARVQQLADLHAPALGGALGSNASSFAQHVADTRNYYIHYDDTLADKAATDLVLVIMIDRLWTLIRACVLAELGFDAQHSAELLSLDPRVQSLSQQP
jgi:hypothetical protein